MTPVTINGKRYDIDLPCDTPLLWALRDELGLTGTKFGCGMALCGACTVHLDGQAVRSCMTPLSAAANKKVTTIEAIEADKVGKAVQTAWIEINVPAVRLLPGGPDHVGDGAAQAQPEAHRRRHRQRAWPATSAGAAPTRGSAARSSRRRACRERSHERAPRLDDQHRRPASDRPTSRHRERQPAPASSRASPPSAAWCSRSAIRASRARTTRPSTARTACRTAGSTTRSRSSPSRTTAPSRSSATAPRWDRACAPACR